MLIGTSYPRTKLNTTNTTHLK